MWTQRRTQGEPEPRVSNWSGRQDSNLRPLAPHASALPGCATPRPRDRMIAQMSLKILSAACLAAKNLDQLFELEPHLMNELLALVEIHLRVVAGEAVPCAANGKPLFIQEAPYLPDDQHVLPLIIPAVAATLDGLELGEFLFPVAQHMRFDAAQVADFTDGEIPLS